MRYLLQVLLRGYAPLEVGRYSFITYDDGTMAVRQQCSGLMSNTHKITRAGLNRCLAWIDDMESGKDLETD